MSDASDEMPRKRERWETGSVPIDTLNQASSMVALGVGNVVRFVAREEWRGAAMAWLSAQWWAYCSDQARERAERTCR